MSTNGLSGKNHLEERLVREAQFHDAKYTGADLYPKHYSVRPTHYVYEQMRIMMGKIEDKHVLEYGCGEGWITLDLATAGATISAFDISAQAVENTRTILTKNELTGCCSLDVMPAEKLNYADNTFDMAVGFAIIHHLDLNKALTELYRVLRPGGVAYFAEPLGTNPLIQLYRKFTPQFRTEDERPLVLSELPELLKDFASYHHKEYFLTALAAIGLIYLPGGISLYPILSKGFHKLDKFLLQTIKPLGNWAWYTIIRITK